MEDEKGSKEKQMNPEAWRKVHPENQVAWTGYCFGIKIKSEMDDRILQQSLQDLLTDINVNFSITWVWKLFYKYCNFWPMIMLVYFVLV